MQVPYPWRWSISAASRGNVSATALQNILNARITDTQRFSLVAIKYTGRLIDMKHDAPEVNAKLSGRPRLGLAVKGEVLSGGTFLAALPCAHTKHG